MRRRATLAGALPLHPEDPMPLDLAMARDLATAVDPKGR